MRKLLLLIAVLGFVGTLWAADPIEGTWKLNITKSKPAPGEQMGVKELTVISRSIGTDIETIFQGIGTDGTSFSMKSISPQQGGIIKSEQPATEGNLTVITVIGPLEMYGTSIEKGKQVEVTHTVVSKDGKTLNRTVKTMNAQGKLVESLQVFEKQ
jgi:hypothetical protein